jgi:putative nucleotidyltransferase with HDIG domain
MGAAPALTFSTSDLLKKLEELPTLPTIVYELTSIINDPMSSTNDIENIMKNDISLTTRVLKLANSAYYAIPGGVSSLSRAIAYIGFDTVNQLVLAASIIDALDLKQPTAFDVNEFWKHSIGVGIASETIAKYVRHPTPSDLFTAGLVHDMGKIAVCAYNVDIPSEVTKLAIEHKLSYTEVEEKFHIPKHTEVGRLLAEKWRLPQHMTNAIKWHHEKTLPARGALSQEMNRNVDIIFLANLLMHALKFGNSGHQKILGAPEEVMGRLMLSPTEDFLKLLKVIKSNLDKAEEFIRHLLGGKNG